MFVKEWFKNLKRKFKIRRENAAAESNAASLSTSSLLLELKPVIYDTADLISETVGLNLVKFENKPIVLKLQVDEQVPSTLYGDTFKIKQILNNLLTNAAQYTERGRVTLSITAERGGDRNGITLVIKTTVESDQGKGAEFTVRLPQGNTGADCLGKEVVKNLRQFRLSKKPRIKYSPVNANACPTAELTAT